MERRVYKRCKREIGVESAATIENRTTSASLSKFSFIFTTETHAKHGALNTVSVTNRKNFSLFTDSKNFKFLKESNIFNRV